MSQLENTPTIGQRGTPTASELLAAVEAAGGELRIPNPPTPVRVRLRRAIYALINQGELPAGTRVRHTGRDRGDLVISIVSISDSPRPEPRPDPIFVPTSLRGCHPIVKATEQHAKAGKDGWIVNRGIAGVVHLRITKANLRRSLLFIQGVIDEAQRRGYRVGTGERHDCKGGFQITIRGHSYEVSVKEPSRQVAHVPTDYELTRMRQYSWATPDKWDYVPTGRLEIHCGHGGYQAPLASDRERWKLEDRIARVFERLEEKADSDDERERKRQDGEQEKRHAWERAVEQAKTQLVEQHLRDWLMSQVDGWRLADQVRTFAEAARRTADLSEDDQLWLKWVLAYAESIDPIGRPLAPPPPPEPSPEQLKPYLGRWSPYGPNGGW